MHLDAFKKLMLFYMQNIESISDFSYFGVTKICLAIEELMIADIDRLSNLPRSRINSNWSKEIWKVNTKRAKKTKLQAGILFVPRSNIHYHDKVSENYDNSWKKKKEKKMEAWKSKVAV